MHITKLWKAARRERPIFAFISQHPLFQGSYNLLGIEWSTVYSKRKWHRLVGFMHFNSGREHLRKRRESRTERKSNLRRKALVDVRYAKIQIKLSACMLILRGESYILNIHITKMYSSRYQSLFVKDYS